MHQAVEALDTDSIAGLNHLSNFGFLQRGRLCVEDGVPIENDPLRVASIHLFEMFERLGHMLLEFCRYFVAWCSHKLCCGPILGARLIVAGNEPDS